MGKVIVYTNEFGDTSVVYPVISTEDVGMTKSEALIRANSSLPSTAINIKEIDSSTLPSDRYFREAWSIKISKVEVDMPKARVIHMDNLKLLRVKKLKELDIEFSKFTGQKKSAEATAVEAKRQMLRDMPTILDLTIASTPEALKTIIPNELI